MTDETERLVQSMSAVNSAVAEKIREAQAQIAGKIVREWALLDDGSVWMRCDDGTVVRV